jgi:hypothetical protein
MRHGRGVADTLTAVAVHLAGWTTASATDGERGGTITAKMSGSSLTQQSTLSGWATPKASRAGPDLNIKERGEQAGLSLPSMAILSGWASPTVTDNRGSAGDQENSSRHSNRDLPRMAPLSGWPTAAARDHKDCESSQGQRQLPEAAILAGWPTPAGMEGGQTSRGGDRKGELLIGGIVRGLAGWGTPTAKEPGGTPEQCKIRKLRAREKGARIGADALPLSLQAGLVGWTSPQAHDAKGGRSRGQKAIHGTRHGCADLPADALLTGWNTPMAGTPAQNGNNYAGNTDSARRMVALSWGPVAASEAGQYGPLPPMGPARLDSFGRLSIGSFAGTDSGGQLNPELPRWLMRLPAEWASCAPTETASTLRRRQASAKSS